MLTKTQFKDAVQYVIGLEERVNQLNHDIVEFCGGDQSLAGFYMEDTGRIVSWVEDAMNDRDGLLSWWLWDCPNRGRAENESSYTITAEDEPPAVLKTLDDLYEYLMRHYAASSDDEYMHAVYNQQTEGVKFALHTIDQLRETNREVDNDGANERDTLMKLVRDKIENEYRLESGYMDDLDSSQFALFIHYPGEES